MVSFLRDYCCTLCTYNLEGELESRCDPCIERLTIAMDTAHQIGRVRAAMQRLATMPMPKITRDAFRAAYGILGDDTTLGLEKEDTNGPAGDTQ